MTIAVEKQVSLAKAALEASVAFVLFDWMYHYVHRRITNGFELLPKILHSRRAQADHDS